VSFGVKGLTDQDMGENNCPQWTAYEKIIVGTVHTASFFSTDESTTSEHKNK
jgi:hypothetical protein